MMTCHWVQSTAIVGRSLWFSWPVTGCQTLQLWDSKWRPPGCARTCVLNEVWTRDRRSTDGSPILLSPLEVAQQFCVSRAHKMVPATIALRQTVKMFLSRSIRSEPGCCLNQLRGEPAAASQKQRVLGGWFQPREPGF